RRVLFRSAVQAGGRAGALSQAGVVEKVGVRSAVDIARRLRQVAEGGRRLDVSGGRIGGEHHRASKRIVGLSADAENQRSGRGGRPRGRQRGQLYQRAVVVGGEVSHHVLQLQTGHHVDRLTVAARTGVVPTERRKVRG